jgi:dTDP-4-amino-4,6-dideoxygalactose transaminase
MSRVGISKFIFLPMAEPDLGEMERGNLNEAVIDNQIGVGRFIGDFERAWAEYNKMLYGVACNSGTSALHLAIKASGAKKILMPNLTMAGTVWGAHYEGLDIDYMESSPDVPGNKCEITDHDAVVFVHLYGRKAYPDGYVAELKARFPKLIVIDDMAEAHGIMPEGDIACYSFYGNKIITTGEGGMCLTNNTKLADEMRSLANMYFDKERSMIHPKVGYNYRMTNLQAAIGLAQVERIDFILEKRRKIEGWYDKYLPEGVKLPKRDVLWFYDIKVPNAKKAQYYLKSQGCDSRRFFYPMSLQPWANGMKDTTGEKWYQHGLLLPTYNNMTEGDVKWVAELITHTISGYKRPVVI